MATGQPNGLPTGMNDAAPILLAGGGHSHALLLKRWAMRPKQRPAGLITLINRNSTSLYSGMVPGLIAGQYERDAASIDLRQLCDRAGVALVIAEITGIEPDQGQLLLKKRPPLRYRRLSLNLGAESRHSTHPGVPIKPLEAALDFLDQQDSHCTEPFCVVGGGLAFPACVSQDRHHRCRCVHHWGPEPVRGSPRPRPRSAQTHQLPTSKRSQARRVQYCRRRRRRRRAPPRLLRRRCRRRRRRAPPRRRRGSRRSAAHATPAPPQRCY